MRNNVEVFLFINPLGMECYQANTNTQEFVKNHEGRVSLRIIPLVNFRVMNQTKDSRSLALNSKTQQYRDAYWTSLAFLAASMQGQKMGRDFLYQLQVEFNEHQRQLSNELMSELIDRVRLDKEMFFMDLNSEFCKDSFRKGQNLAAKMNIKYTPTSVLYTTKENNQAYKIESVVQPTILERMCAADQVTLPNDISISIL